MRRPSLLIRNSWWLRWVFGVVFAGLFVLFFVFHRSGGWLEILRLCATVLALILMLYLDEWTAGRHVESCKRILDEECDPDKAHEAMDAMLPYRYARRTQARLRLAMAMCLYSMGRYQEAESMLILMRKLPKDCEFTRHGYLSVIHLRMGMVDLARQEAALIDAKCRGIAAARRRVWLDWSQAAILHAQERWEEAFVLARQNAAQARSTRSRVEAYGLMGKCALSKGDDLLARLAFEYVLLHGNRLAIVAEARTALLALKEG